MLQIMSKIKDDLHIVLQLLCFVGHPVQDSNTVNLWKTIFKNKFKNNISPAVHLFSLQLCLLQHRWAHS